MGKAWGAVAMGTASRTQGERMEQRPSVVAALAAASGGRFMPIPGGVLIRDADGSLIVGSVGVSGELSDNDEICAVAGITAAGLIADAGALGLVSKQLASPHRRYRPQDFRATTTSFIHLDGDPHDKSLNSAMDGWPSG